MTSTASIKGQQFSRTRRVFGLFVVLWLNLVLQPCAMAVGPETEHDCPHCPPSHARQHADHDGGTHHQAASERSCVTDTADCRMLDDVNYDGRSAEAKLKDAPKDAPVAVNTFDALIPAVHVVDRAGVCPTRSPPPGQSPPLNVLYCVYLD